MALGAIGTSCPSAQNLLLLRHGDCSSSPTQAVPFYSTLCSDNAQLKLRPTSLPTCSFKQQQRIARNRSTVLSVFSVHGVQEGEKVETETEKRVQTKPKPRPGERKGFVEEMRIRAMKLHTRDQAKEGEKPEQERPLAKWQPTREGYVQFLVDSKLVYNTLEKIMASDSSPAAYATFRATGLERSAALEQDLRWFEEELGVAAPPPGTAGATYAEYLRELATSDPPAFICHFYNVYFAHSAGGRMIGRKVAEMILDGKELEFYKWKGDLQELLSAVRDKINAIAETWTREEKEHCLEETEVVQVLRQPPPHARAVAPPPPLHPPWHRQGARDLEGAVAVMTDFYISSPPNSLPWDNHFILLTESHAQTIQQLMLPESINRASFL